MTNRCHYIVFPCLLPLLSGIAFADPIHPPDEDGAASWVLLAPLSHPTVQVSMASMQEAGEKQEEPDQTRKTEPFVEITVEGDTRRIRTNGLPNHPTGRFPTRGNPNSIKPQEFDFRIPLVPTEAGKPTPVGMNLFGVALNGCFFEAGTAEWWKNDRNSGWHIEAIGPRGGHLGLDFNNGHVQPTGAYHYHSVPTGMIEVLVGEESARKPLLIGWAADGYPIYGPWGFTDPKDPESPVKRLSPSWQLKDGSRPTQPASPGGRYDGTYEEDFHFVEGSGDLDVMNGRFGVTAEFPEGTYYYVVTEEFPFVSRSWKGTPSSDMSKRGGRRGGPGRPGAGDGGGRRGPGGRGGGGRGGGGRRGPQPPPRD